EREGGGGGRECAPRRAAGRRWADVRAARGAQGDDSRGGGRLPRRPRREPARAAAGQSVLTAAGQRPRAPELEPRGGGDRVRVRAARRALPVGGRRPGRMGLL